MRTEFEETQDKPSDFQMEQDDAVFQKEHADFCEKYIDKFVVGQRFNWWGTDYLVSKVERGKPFKWTKLLNGPMFSIFGPIVNDENDENDGELDSNEKPKDRWKPTISSLPGVYVVYKEDNQMTEIFLHHYLLPIIISERSNLVNPT